MSKLLIPNGTRLTVAGVETSFDGVLEFTDSLIITGKFTGTIKSNGYLEIAKTADCVVDEMNGSTVVVSGKVSGNINAEKSLEFCSGSVIAGDVKTKKLRVAENVEFEGLVTMLDSVPELDIFALSPGEYKHQLKGQNAKGGGGSAGTSAS